MAWPVDDRVLAFHRWVPGIGRDVVVVLSLHERTFYDRSYRLGFPHPGRWWEVVNSDYFDTLPNPDVQGNFGGITADGPPLHGMPHSAGITLPTNSILGVRPVALAVAWSNDPVEQWISCGRS